uniref:Trafficking protein particle complex subunit 6B n=1 Tax=Equus caballus TaxID=9796 RepID=A0A9L0T156_HORSE
MADEALFLLLHNEMVSGVYKSAEQGEVENGRCITKLENMGFRVGQGLIERGRGLVIGLVPPTFIEPVFSVGWGQCSSSRSLTSSSIC